MNALHRFLERDSRSFSSLAKAIGVSPSTVFRIARDKRRPSVALAIKIASETGLSMSELLPETAQAFRPENIPAGME